MTDYLTLQEVLAIQALSVEHYGGAQGVRDMGAIEAALFRPQSGYYNDIIEEAAALTESLLINHPFVDGNKRAAFAVCHVFLEINGYLLDAEPMWLYQRMLAWIEAPEDRFWRIVQDLRSCVKVTP
jgi:death-on-curing protein